MTGKNYKLLGIIFLTTILIQFSSCSPGDLKDADKQVNRFFEIKTSGDYSKLDELIHSEAKNELRLEFFSSLFDRQKEVLGDYISHKREKFNYNSSGGKKFFTMVYEVQYSKNKSFWERFTLLNDNDGKFRLVGYAANENKEEVIPKEEN